MTRTNKIVISALTVVAAGWLYATPHITVNAMADAASRHDVEGITSRVDFPALKENLKGQFNAKMMQEVAKAPENEPFAGAGAALGMMLVGPMIDAMVTPEAVGMMLRGQKPSPETLDTSPAKTAEQLDIDMGYRDFNTFGVKVRDRQAPEDQAMTMLFKRHNLVSWKLTAVELPL